jgi:hypothetical protein
MLILVSATASAQSNGIVVGRPKVFEDEALRAMLQDAESALAKLQFVDQAGVASKIGGLQGGQLTQNAFGLSVNGPPLPQIQTTANAPVQNTTGQNSTGSEVDTGTSTTTKNTTSNTANTTNNGATLQTVTTRAAATPSAPTTAASSLSLPTNLANSALTTLNEQMQLTYEIAGLRLLLEGSLTDRYIQGLDIPKKRVTIGFPISITAATNRRNYVAEVEVRVRNLPGSLGDEPPGLVAVLPRERTYNVASITDNSVALSGGVVSQILSFGGSFMHSRKTYYLVQDQDTLAMQFPETAEDEKLAAFGWQFRPVLGHKTVIAGDRQTFAQVSFPISQLAGCAGTVEVLTRWRKYNARSGVVGEPEDEARVLLTPIHTFNLTPQGYQLRWEDLGGGQSEVTLWGTPGWIMPGVAVRVGNTVLNASTGLVSTDSSLRFTAPTDALSTSGVFLVARDGSEVELRHPNVSIPVAALRGCSSQPDTSVPFRMTGNLETDRRSRRRAAAGSATTPQTAQAKGPETNSATPAGSNSVPAPQNLPAAPGANPQTAQAKAPDTNSGTPAGSNAVPAPQNGPAGPDANAAKPARATVTVGPAIYVKIHSAKAASYDPNQTLVSVDLDQVPGDDFTTAFPLVAVLGGKTFGLRDVPFQSSSGKQITFLVPTALARSSRNVAVRRLFWGPAYSDQAALSFSDEFSASAPVLLSKNADGSNTFLITGTDLNGASIAAPISRSLQTVGSSSTAATFTLQAGEISTVQQIVVQKTGGQVAVLSMPKPDASKPSLKDHDPVPVKSPSVVIDGSQLGGLQSVTCKKGDQKFDLVFTAAKDGNSVTLTLPDALAGDALVLNLTFSFKDNTVLPYSLKLTR